MSKNKKILEVKNLQTSFFTDDGVIKAVDNVSFEVSQGRTLGIVGESGCGKSVTSLSIMRLIPNPPGKIVGGEIKFEGRNLLELDSDSMRNIRGNEISMIFQEPMTSLNPVFTIGNQIMEAIALHENLPKKDRLEKAINMLKWVGIPAAERRVKEYPHQLSGGMRQRVMIAMALCCDPKILIADEPTTALDVTIQAQILDLLRDLKEKIGLAIVLITHDLGVIAEMADDVVVMYAGHIVESGPVHEIFEDPRHPYTQGLLSSIPALEKKERLKPIKGIVPSLLNLPKGCRFQERCEYASEECRIQDPELRQKSVNHVFRCVKDIRYSQN